MKTLHKPLLYPNQHYSQMMSVNQMHTGNPIANAFNVIKNGNQVHQQNLLCFECCSTWVLKMASLMNKKKLSEFDSMGKLQASFIEIMAKSRTVPQNLTEYLPIDLKQNQRFVLDQKMPKINLNLVFNFNGELNQFTVISQCYSLLLFEINLIGILHGMQLLKEPIDFRVKGYDIDRSIRNVLNENGVNISDIILRDTVKTVFNVTVFSNVQCSFSVEFSITNANLSNYYLSLRQFGLKNTGNINLSQLGIVITKLKIVYSLPVCVFSYQNNKVLTQKKIQKPIFNQQLQEAEMRVVDQYVNCLPQMGLLFQDINHNVNSVTTNTNVPPTYLIRQQSLEEEGTKRSAEDFIAKAIQGRSNWSLFMRYTTPVVLMQDELRIVDILQGFVKPGLFGLTCAYAVQEQQASMVTYFPSLSSIYIEETKCSSPKEIVGSCSTSAASNFSPMLNGKNSCLLKNESPSSDLEEGDLTNNSYIQDDCTINTASPSIINKCPNRGKALFYAEKTREAYNKPVFINQIQSFLKFHPKASSLTLSDISTDSYFSITWTPSKLIKQNNHSPSHLKSLSSLKVYYNLKDNSLSGKPQALTVLGLVETTIRGESIHPLSLQLSDFWFNNILNTSGSSAQTALFLLKDKLTLSYLMEKGYKYALKDQHSL